METFQLFGKELEVTVEQKNYAYFVNQFSEIRKTAVNNFLTSYRGNYPSIGTWDTDIIQKFKASIDYAVKESVDLLRDNGVYTITQKEFMEASWDSDGFEDVINEMGNEIWQIVQEAENEIQYRQQRKDNRSRAAGFGFGMKGYVKASMKAGAINMATGLGHSIVNGIGNAGTNAASNSKINSILRDENYIAKLGIEVALAVFDMQEYAILILETDAGIKCDVVSDDDRHKSSAIMESMSTIPSGNKKQALLQALELNYLNSDVYEYIVTHYRSERRDADAMASYLGLDVSEPICQEFNDKIQVVMQKYAQLMVVSFEPGYEITEIYRLYKELQEEIEEIGWDENKISKRIPVYNTLEECITSLPYKYGNYGFAKKEELLDCCKELTSFYHDMKSKDLNNQVVYAETQVEFDKYEKLNLYHYEILYKELERIRRIQSDSEVVNEVMDLWDKGLSRDIRNKFIFAGTSSDYQKHEKQIAKWFSLRAGEKLIVDVRTAVKAGIAFTTERVLIYSNFLLKDMSESDISIVLPFIPEDGKRIRLRDNLRDESTVLTLADDPQVVFLYTLALNSILRIMQMHQIDITTTADIKKSKEKMIVDSPKKQSDTMFCPFCGKKIQRTAKFCTFCGKQNNYSK
ncbi:zinc ribbon domain-containing protein [Eubacterium ramulus]